MPPKGWRKNASGQYPQPNREELTSIDDILFPKSTVTKLAKKTVPPEMLLGKDSVTALQRSATVFVSHLLFQARELQRESGKKIVTDKDIINAMQRADFGGFVPEIESRLAQWEQTRQQKKSLKAAAAASGSPNGKLRKTSPGAAVDGTDATDDAADDTQSEDEDETKDEADDETKEEEDDDDTKEEEEEEEDDTPAPVAPNDLEVVADLGDATDEHADESGNESD
ncbi:DNA polymerase epsilon subunit D [Diutina catenulata]